MSTSFTDLKDKIESEKNELGRSQIYTFTRQKYVFHENFGKELHCQDETTKAGRFYSTPEGNKYPSITTILSKSKSQAAEKALSDWRERLGKEVAQKETTRAANRGTKLHKIAEDYILLKEESFDTDNTLFKQIHPYLNRINNIRAIESALYSDRIKTAGRVDLIAEFDGKLSIIDFKGSTKEKRKLWIEDYFIQETAYAIMYAERFGEKIENIVTIIAVEETGEPQLFIEKPGDYLEKLVARIRTFNERNVM